MSLMSIAIAFYFLYSLLTVLQVLFSVFDLIQQDTKKNITLLFAGLANLSRLLHHFMQIIITRVTKTLILRGHIVKHIIVNKSSFHPVSYNHDRVIAQNCPIIKKTKIAFF